MTQFSDVFTYLKHNSPEFALMTLRSVIGFPKQLNDAEDWKTTLGILSKIYPQENNLILSNLCLKCSTNIEDTNSQYLLGSALININEPAIAASILAYSLKLNPLNVDILTELVSALELMGCYNNAVYYLTNSSVKGFLPQYLLAFNSLMTGDIDESRSIYTQLSPSDTNDTYMQARLERIFNRIDYLKDKVTLNPTELRNWHFAITGSLLLHQSSKEISGIKGRYDNLEDSEALCLEGIKRLASVMDSWDITPPQIQAFQNTESLRLGYAIAGYLNLPIKEVLIPEESGLFVAYDIDGIIPEVLSNLENHLPGISIYSNALRWSKEHSFTPDITNVFYDTLVSPWNRHTIFPWRPDLPSGPPTGSDKEIAQHILDSQLPSNALDDLPELLALAKVGKEIAASLKTEGKRERCWSGYRNI